MWCRIKAGLRALITMAMVSCGSESSPPSGSPGSASCPSPLRMSDGEIVTYSFAYVDGTQTNHTITKIADGDEMGAIVYSISDGRTFNVNLKELCGGNNGSRLGIEESFLLTGSSLVVSSQQNDDQDAPSPLDFSEQNCSQETVVVDAGEFSANRCTFVANGSPVSFTRTEHESLGQATPLGGLLKFELTNTARDVIVEIQEWNGI